MENSFYIPTSELLMQEARMAETRDYPLREPESENRKKNKSPESSVSESLILIEKRRKSLETRLINSLVPPDNPLYKVIWKIAVDIARFKVEASAKEKKDVDSILQSKIEFGARVRRIAEGFQALISERLILPILMILLSSEFNIKLQNYSRDYAELLQLKNDDPSVENDTDILADS